MTGNFRPSMIERSIGRVLQSWRYDTGMSLAEVSKDSGFSPAKLSLNENAIYPFDPLDIMLLGHLYAVPNGAWKHEVRRAEFAARERAQIRRAQSSFHLNATKDVDESYLEATKICAYGADLIPRLAQTPEYRIAATALGCPTHPGNDPRLKAEQQEEWINTLSSDTNSDVAVALVVTKRAILQLVGDPVITSAALVQLVNLSRIENFDIQVLDDSDTPDLQTTSSYTHLHFPHEQHDDVVYVEHAGSGRYIEDPAACQLIQQGFKALQGNALSFARSKEEISRAAGSFALPQHI